MTAGLALCAPQGQDSQPVVFDGRWRSRCAVRHAELAEIRWMIQEHYLRRRPGVVVCRLVMTLDERPVGMVIFGLPPRETNKRYGAPTWELARLWIEDEIPANAESWLIAKAVKHCRAEHRSDVSVLVSYADPSVGHSGIIYQAANWIRDGRTDEGRKSPRCDYVWMEKKYSRKAHLPEGAVPVRIPRVSKWRYIYRL